MKRKGLISFGLAALMLTPLAGCGSKAESGKPVRSSESDSAESVPDSSSNEASNHESDANGDLFTYSHGSFTLIGGWHKYDPQSTDAKPFFVPEDYDGVGIPDNISVEYGTNYYSKDDAVSFSHAILEQLSPQVHGLTTEEITASGITSDKGEPVLVFNIPMKDCQITHYYICGDHEHILVYETNFSGSSECDEVAQAIVNTFEWNKQN